METRLEAINRQIQQEKNRHTRTINKLKKEICKQNERHQRTIEYLQNQKKQIGKKMQYETFDELIKKCLQKF